MMEHSKPTNHSDKDVPKIPKQDNKWKLWLLLGLVISLFLIFLLRGII